MAKDFKKKLKDEGLNFSEADLDRVLSEAFGRDDDEDDDDLTPAEKKLAAMGTKLDKDTEKKLKNADEKSENKAVSRVKKEKDEEDEEEDDVKKEGVTIMTQKYQLSERDRAIAGIVDPMESIEKDADVILIYENDKVSCCFAKDQWTQARAYLSRAKSAAGSGATVRATGIKFKHEATEDAYSKSGVPSDHATTKATSPKFNTNKPAENTPGKNSSGERPTSSKF